MIRLWIALLTSIFLQISVHAADKIRISTPGDASQFTMHLAPKRGSLAGISFSQVTRSYIDIGRNF
jgi:hypothetical protein